MKPQLGETSTTRALVVLVLAIAVIVAGNFLISKSVSSEGTKTLIRELKPLISPPYTRVSRVDLPTAGTDKDLVVEFAIELGTDVKYDPARSKVHVWCYDDAVSRYDTEVSPVFTPDADSPTMATATFKDIHREIQGFRINGYVIEAQFYRTQGGAPDVSRFKWETTTRLP